MAMIGEELMALLGMIPVRDQAGIPRGNLAQETAANAARMKATLEPQPDQMPVRGPPISAPPDVQLPGDVPVGYASAKSPVSTAIPPNARTVQNALPNSPLPEPDEARTIATAPSNAMTQLDGQIARREQMGQMNSVLSGLQLLANSFNRNPDSAAAIRTSAMEGLGGGMDVKDITEIYKTHELLQKADEERRAAAQAVQLRERMIQNMMAKRGWSREQAEGAIATGTAKDVYDQDKTRQYAEDQATVAQRDDMLKRKGEIAKKLGMTEDEVATQLKTREGTTDLVKRLDPESLSTIEGRKATTRSTLATADKTELDNQSTRLGLDDVAKVIADPTEAAAVLKRPASEVALFARQGPTEWKAYLKDHLPTALTERAAKEATRTETELKNARTTAANMSWLAARADPAAWAAKHGLDPRLANPMLENVESYTEFLKTAAPTHSTLGQEWNLINSVRASENAQSGAPAKPPLSPEAVKTMGVNNPKPTLEEKGLEEAMNTTAKAFEKADEDVRTTHNNLTTSSPHLQRFYSDNRIAGSGLSQWNLDAKKALGFFINAKGTYDDKVVNTEGFEAMMHEHVLNKAKALKPLSNSDFAELSKMTGASLKTDPNSVKLLLRAADLVQRAEVEKRNNEVLQQRQSKNPGVAAFFRDKPLLEQPPPANFTVDHFERKPPDPKVAKIYPTGRAWLQASIADGSIHDPTFKHEFEQIYGIGTLPHFRNQLAPEGLPWTDPRR